MKESVASITAPMGKIVDKLRKFAASELEKSGAMKHEIDDAVKRVNTLERNRTLHAIESANAEATAQKISETFGL